MEQNVDVDPADPSKCFDDFSQDIKIPFTFLNFSHSPESSGCWRSSYSLMRSYRFFQSGTAGSLPEFPHLRPPAERLSFPKAHLQKTWEAFQFSVKEWVKQTGLVKMSHENASFFRGQILKGLNSTRHGSCFNIFKQSLNIVFPSESNKRFHFCYTKYTVCKCACVNTPCFFIWYNFFLSGKCFNLFRDIKKQD